MRTDASSLWWERACKLFSKAGGRLRVAEHIPLRQWCEQFIELTTRSSSRPGKYQANATPQLVGVYTALDQPHVRRVTALKGARVGWTTLLVNWIISRVARKGTAAGLFFPTRSKADKFYKTELKPRILACKAIRQFLPRRRRTKFTAGLIQFINQDLWIVATGSPTEISGFNVEDAALDEIDKGAEENEKGEASAFDLALVRTNSYLKTRKVAAGSTPTVKTAVTVQEFLKGTMEEFMPPCPKCGVRHVVLFEDLDWDHIPGVKDKRGVYNLDLVEQHTCWKCPSCKELIPQSQKAAMALAALELENDGWVVKNHDAPRDHRSFWIRGEMASHIDWGELAKQFLQCKDKPGGLHDFYNSWLGRWWERTAGRVTPKVIKAVQKASPAYEIQEREEGKRRQLPAEPGVIVMTVDVQQDHYWFVVRLIARDGSSWLLDYGTVVSFTEIDGYADETWEWNGRQYSMWLGLIDSGHRAKRGSSVYGFITERPGRWMAVKGGGFKPERGKPPINEVQVEHIHNGEAVEIDLIHFNDDAMKEHLYDAKLKGRQPPPWYLPRTLTGAYIQQLTSERLRDKKESGGRIVQEWISEGPNHLGDCEKICEIFRFILTPEVLARISDVMNGTIDSGGKE